MAYGFRSSQSTADLLTVLSDRIVRAFNRSGATLTVALDISKAFDRVWHAGLFHKLESYGISGQILGLISSFLSKRRLRVVLDGKLSVLMILLSVLSAIRHLTCGNNLNWLLNLNLIYESLWTGLRSGLFISMLGKLSWFHLTGQITMVLLM